MTRLHTLTRLRGFPAVLIIALVLLGLVNAFIQDDAFITFRYADHLARGHGPVWNIAERPVEGYTNFLWMLAMAAGAWLHLDLEVWSQSLGLALGAATLYQSFRLAGALTGSRRTALLTVFLLGTNYSFSSYMTGGLETQLQAFLFVLMIRLSLQLEAAPSWQALTVLSLIMAMAMLTRMDSVLACVLIVLLPLWPWWRDRGSRAAMASVLQLLAPAVLIMLIWLLWKLDYYGSILPNTYQAKMATIFMGAVTEGLLYVISFLAFYQLIVFVPYWLFVGRRIFNMPGMGQVIWLLLVWAAYVISIGGDFMEYRLLIPVLPLLMLLVAITLFDIAAGLRVALCCALVVASAWHALNFRGLVSIEPISSLSHHIENPAAAWREVGISLGQTLGGGHSTITIATTAAGAIPYYSQLRTVDMLGLNDSWVARHGDPLVRVNGHRKYAPLRYLIRQGVHLVIGHPSLRRHGQLVDRRPESYFWSAINRDELPAGSRVLALPVGDDRVLQVLYIRRHMLIERLIREGRLQAYALE